MKLSRKQQLELEAIKEFIPSWCTFEPITDDDLKTFFDFSDRGIKYEMTPDKQLTGLGALHYGKQYRDLHITMYRQDIQDGYIGKWEVNTSEWINKALKGARPKQHVYKLWNDLQDKP